MNILLIIPARGGSKGLKRKNLRLLSGIPLIGHTINAAKNSNYSDHVVVTTEDQEIADYCREFVSVQLRPDEMATDKAKVDPLLQYTIERYEEENGLNIDVAVLLYPTAPLRISEDVNRALETYINGGYDSLLSLYEDDRYLWSIDDKKAWPINYDPMNRKPRQEEGWNQYAENKAVYVMNRDLIMNTGCRLGERIGYITMPAIRSIDIDSAKDLFLAELILEHQDRLL